ncbi:peptidoglycan recognition protein family protein [Leucobacter luti]|uniref:peptidoglycan recognition protein family protein n=1 Tax=Leucobacter luti TaxID=340320 RepID=UPI003D0029F5
MGFSPLANTSRRIPDVGRSVPREARVTGLGLHHNAGVDAYGQATAAGREVSANYWIANDGTIIPNIDETRRAFTSGAAGYPDGAQADHRNITVEISNSPEGVRSGSWAISNAARAALVALIADVYRRYGLGTVRRSPTSGVGVHQDWVPTACPGPYVMAELPSIIAEANAKANHAGGTPTNDEGEEDMRGIIYRSTQHGKFGCYAGPTGGFVILANEEEFKNLTAIGTPVVWLTPKTLQELISDARKMQQR